MGRRFLQRGKCMLKIIICDTIFVFKEPFLRDTQRHNFAVVVGMPFLLQVGVLFVRFKGLFLNVKKNVSVRIRLLNFQTFENSRERNIITRFYELQLPFRKC